MNTTYDRETDSLYIDLADRPSVESVEIAPDVIMDLDADGRPVGFDIKHASLIVDAEALKPKSVLERAVYYIRRKGVVVKGRGARTSLLPRSVAEAAEGR